MNEKCKSVKLSINKKINRNGNKDLWDCMQQNSGDKIPKKRNWDQNSKLQNRNLRNKIEHVS